VTVYRAILIIVSAHLKYWSPTIRAPVVALFDPVFNALGVKVVTFIATELGYDIS
jgi:hypothetical protein